MLLWGKEYYVLDPYDKKNKIDGKWLHNIGSYDKKKAQIRLFDEFNAGPKERKCWGYECKWGPWKHTLNQGHLWYNIDLEVVGPCILSYFISSMCIDNCKCCM